MVFSSMIFIWVFLPIVFILDKAAWKSKRIQNLLLLVAGLLFYAWGQPDYLWLLMVSILINFFLGLAICGRQGTAFGRVLLAVGVVANLGILGYYKYFNFFVNTINKAFGGELLEMREIALPLGISFFTFQAVTYLVDLYRGKCAAQKNILHMALYFAFFPKLTQGPIERYRDFSHQLKDRVQSLEKISAGIRRFIYGLAKKVLIADVLGECVDRLYGLELGNVSFIFIWIAVLFYSLQLYYDFSGYSDMAVGLGKMFGFDLAENFNYPYMASSITDFWRRWHMSLTAWFREYLYFPLGGSRKGALYTYRNIFIVYMATGLWHGASWDFICWGLFHGFFQILERMGLGKFLEKTKVIKYVYTVLVVGVGWLFFRVGNMGLSVRYLGRMFLPWKYSYSGYAVQELVPNQAFFACLCAILGCGLIQRAGEKLSVKFPPLSGWKGSAVELAWCMLLLCGSIVMMVSSTYSAFLYMNF